MSILLECSSRNDKNKISNSNWTNTFGGNPITINKGDVLNMKIGFIEDLSPSVNTINISNDTQATITFGYYVNIWDMNNSTLMDDTYWNPYHTFQTAPAGSGIIHNPNSSAFNKYIAWKWNGKPFNYQHDTANCSPLVNTANVIIKMGKYTGQELAQQITDQLSSLTLEQEQSNGYFNPSVDKQLMFNTGKGGLTEGEDYITHFWSIKDNEEPPNMHIDNGFVYSTHTSNITPADTHEVLFNDASDYFVGTSQIALIFNNDNKFEWQYLHSPIFNSATGSPQLSTAIVNLQNATSDLYIPANRENKSGWYKYLTTTSRYVTTDVIKSLVVGANLILKFNDGTEQNVIVTVALSKVGGLKDFWSLQVNNNVTNGNPLIIVVANANHKINNHWRQSSSEGGIYLVNLTSNTSVNVWEQLGFNLSDITTGYNETYQPIIEKFERATTKSFIGLSGLTSKTGGMKILPNQPLPINTTLYLSTDSQSTQGITADDYHTNNNADGGYYKVECNSVFHPSHYENDTAINHSTLSIVSKQWSNQSFITDFGEGSMLYQHTSDEPLILSSANFRILNANDVEANNLGDCSVFLQITSSS